MKNNVILLFVLSVLNVLYAQSEQQRKEYYQKMFANNEAVIKNYNKISQQNADILWSNMDRPTEFHGRYYLFKLCALMVQEKDDSIYRVMNDFTRTPEMSYLQKMNEVSSRKNKVLTELSDLLTEVNNEINSKGSDRWDPALIDRLYEKASFKNQMQVYNKLKMHFMHIEKLRKIHDKIANYKCIFNDWAFCVTQNFPISYKNPLDNYNMDAHLPLYWYNFTAAQTNRLDYGSMYFSANQAKAWLDKYSRNLNLTASTTGMYDSSVGNSKNALLFCLMVNSYNYDFSEVSKLLNRHKMTVRNCTYNKYNTEWNYYYLDEFNLVRKYSDDSMIALVEKDAKIINALYAAFTIVDQPYFYMNIEPQKYINIIKKADQNAYNLFDIKRNIFLSNIYYHMIVRDLEILGVSEKKFKKFYEGRMNSGRFNLYFTDRYLLESNKKHQDTWAVDVVKIMKISNELRLLKYYIDNDPNFLFSKGKDIFGSSDLTVLLENKNNVLKIDELDNRNAEDYIQHIAKFMTKPDYVKYLKSASRAIVLKKFEVATKYVEKSTKLKPNSVESTIVLNHLKLFTGQFEAALLGYKSLKMDHYSVDNNSTVRDIIKSDFSVFLAAGLNSSDIEKVTKELGI
jgi:hypothetical protein